MSDRYSSGYSLKAPGAAPAGTSYRLPSRAETLHVDDHRSDIDFETEEMVGGKVYKTMGAELPHAAQNGEIDFVLRGLLKPEYCVASDLKTRVEDESDFASDSAAVRRGVDPETGRRYRERLAFEVVAEQPRSVVTAKAPRMLRQGVHRVFAVFVHDEEVAEWSGTKNDWVTLKPSAVIQDTCLVRPLPVAALLDAAKANAAVVRGLEAQGDPEILRIRSEGKAEGKVEGLREAIFKVFELRGLDVSAEVRTAIESCDDLATLERWHAQAVTGATAEDALA